MIAVCFTLTYLKGIAQVNAHYLLRIVVLKIYIIYIYIHMLSHMKINDQSQLVTVVGMNAN